MKKLFVELCLLLMVTQIYAQWYNRSFGVSSLNELNEIQLNQALQITEKKIKSGTIWTVVGIGYSVVGGILVANAIGSNSDSFDNLGPAIGGAMSITTGTICLLVGIPKWANNAGRKKQIELALIQLNSPSSLGNFQPYKVGYKQPPSMGLNITFHF